MGRKYKKEHNTHGKSHAKHHKQIDFLEMLEKVHFETILAFSEALEARDQYTAGWTIPQPVNKVKQLCLNNNHEAPDSQAPNESARGYNNLRHKKTQPALRHWQSISRSVFPPLSLMF